MDTHMILYILVNNYDYENIEIRLKSGDVHRIHKNDIIDINNIKNNCIIIKKTDITDVTIYIDTESIASLVIK